MIKKILLALIFTGLFFSPFLFSEDQEEKISGSPLLINGFAVSVGFRLYL
ncbi:MAG: hypothetical protein JXJ04_19755 [Spirochaetales bacterium]|nr:hypothetical protein [Spirochaetales bacterium]